MPVWYPNRIEPLNGDFIKEQVSILRSVGSKLHISHADLNIAYWRTHGWMKRKRISFDSYENCSAIIEGAFWPRNTSVTLDYWISAYANWVIASIDRLQPDLLHAHTYLGAAICALVQRKRNLPFIVTLHYSGWTTNKFRTAHYKRAVGALPEASHVVSVSQTLRDITNQFHNVPSSTIPNFIDTQEFRGPELIRSKNPFIVLGVGDLIERKQFNILIKAFAEMLKSIPSAQLRIVGNGPLKTDLENLSSELQIFEMVTFTGVLSKEAVANEYRRANILVQTSKAESFGITLIEALFSSLPVISFSHKAAIEILSKCSGGYLVPMNDIVALSEMMISVFNRYELIDFKNIRASVAKEFGTKSATDKYLEVYNSIL